MVQAVKVGDLSINFADLRMKYAASPDYEPEGFSDETKDMYRKLNSKDYQGAVKTANAVLEKQYVNIDAHMVASAAYAGLNDEEQAALHHNIAVGLLRSILESGDGASTATAYKVIAIAEEYSLMRAEGWLPGKQSYLQENKKSYDKMEMRDAKSGTTITKYFDVTLSDEDMMKSLRAK
jgi:Domain of unknown function (DUF4919)